MRRIDADALIEHLRKDPLFNLVERYGITRVIEAQPTVDAEPVRHGKWITDSCPMDDYDYLMTRCTACGTAIEYGMGTPYCPFCGAKMEDGGEHESD